MRGRLSAGDPGGFRWGVNGPAVAARQIPHPALRMGDLPHLRLPGTSADQVVSGVLASEERRHRPRPGAGLHDDGPPQVAVAGLRRAVLVMSGDRGSRQDGQPRM
ncbi:hypothetical protein KEM60_01296 [Austwickia sp. TVS 96-490-7B]|uniref:hypothetical protein n=1 Tax=Austwickia sp. TVS 96-490-7B TaxID=2830843 RepID=UPI001C584CD5|nr:hypothetical protein [Austwickia sp. TVS 96-490-7B]MBW3085103.1 hypothetical protein [Austwickia sp. TVS 96-490-7B]